MRKIIFAISLATCLLFAGLTVVFANEDMDGGGGSGSNNQAAGAAGAAATAGLVAGAAASGGAASQTAPAPANGPAAGASPPDDSDSEFEGESTPGPEEPSPECVACKAQWDLLAAQRAEARHRLVSGLGSLSHAYVNLNIMQGGHDQLVAERNQALALGGLSIGVAMAYGGVIAARLAGMASSARNLAGLCRIWGGAENAMSAVTLTEKADALGNAAMAVTGVDLAGGSAAAAAMWAKINAGVDQFDAALQQSQSMADALNATCHDVQGNVEKIQAQMENLKNQMKDCGFDTDFGDVEPMPDWPSQYSTGSVRG